MKDLSSRWLAATLLAPLLVVLSIILLAGSHSQAASSGGTGLLQVAFDSPPGSLTTADGAPIPAEYQRVILNIVAVRLNPSSKVNVRSGWVKIPAPATTASRIVQVDLKALQNLPFLFNLAGVPPNTYKQIELQLDPTNPATVVPLCTTGLEGCVPYSVSLTGTLRGLFTTDFVVTRDSTQPLVITLGGTLGPGAALSLTATPEDNDTTGSLSYNPVLGIVTGKVTNFDLKKTTVTAELSGTNQIIVTTKLHSDGSFSLNLPALDTPSGGTFYDFYVAGSGSYVVISHHAVFAQGASPAPPITDLDTLAVPKSKFASIIGKVFDACVGTTKPIEGVTLQLLVPDTSAAPDLESCDPAGDPPTIPASCVVVGTAATDQRGIYPLAGTSKVPQPFNHIPVSPPSGVTHYDVEVSAPGYNTLVQETAKGGNGQLSCPGSGFNKNHCNFNLEHGYMSGTVSLSSPNDTTTTLNVMVNAEDSGTNHIENFTFAQIPVGQTSGSFKMPVPHGTPLPERPRLSSAVVVPAASPSISPTPPVPLAVSSFDVFAVVQDLFGGTSQKISGHTIAVVAGVAAPPPTPSPSPTPSTTPSSTPTSTPNACSTVSVSLAAVDCVGHGSVFGTVAGANPGTSSVVLSKRGESGTPVQIEQTDPDSIGFPSNNFYNFCAPVDTYLLTHYENVPAASPTSVSSAEVTFATPATVSAPCKGICGSTPDSCLLCQNAVGPDL